MVEDLPSLQTKDFKRIRNDLILWGKKNFQNYPWRFTKEPYKIMIAELMLHRTQAKQVVPVYEQFINRIPDLKEFLLAQKEEILSIFAPLGLHWRTVKILELRDIICSNYNNQIPDNFDQLIDLPGVNTYIACAILCFSYSKQVILVDTNTVRVVARIQGIALSDTLRRNKKFLASMSTVLGQDHLRELNYAIIDLAHLVCRVRKPYCNSCPLRTNCSFGLSQMIN